MKNFIHTGDRAALTAPAGGAISGQPMLVGSLFAIPSKSAAEGEFVPVMLEGTFRIAKATDISISEGQKIYWNDSERHVTTTASGNKKIGAAVENVSTAATMIKVRLDGMSV